MCEVKISNDTEQVLIGGLLGDSYLRKQYSNSNPYLSIAHGPLQLNYLKYKYKFFEKDGLLTDRGIYEDHTYLKKTKKHYLSYKFHSKSLKIFNTYYYDFYLDNIKIVTEKVLNKLQPLGLAIWFMDDGSRHFSWYTRKDNLKSIKSRKIRISTNGFSFSEHELMQEYFKSKWTIKTGIHKNNNKYTLHFNSTNANKLIDIIKDYVLPSLKYKIDLAYDVTNPLTAEERIQRMSFGQPNSRIMI